MSAPTNYKKKRAAGAADGASPTPAVKRRKPSSLSVSSLPSVHPLRQTSFPPDESATALALAARSPSVDFDTSSLVSAGGASSVAPGGKKKRGRKPKGDAKGDPKSAAARDATPSVVGGRAASTVAASAVGKAAHAAEGGAGAAAAGAGAGADDDDEGEGDVPDSGAAADDKRTDEERKEEKRLRAALVACMDMDQYERISAWRAAKLPDAVIKRLVNATVSQSVPPSVVTAVRSVTKYFLTDLITAAQRVQDEWIAGDPSEAAQTDGDVPWPGMVLARGEPAVQALYDEQASLAIPEWEPEAADHILRDNPKGPLRPDHLREAWRRYRSTVQSKTAGALDLWHAQQSTGVERFPARTGGRRIFK